MAEFVLNRSHTLRTTNGVITFVKGQPTSVPRDMERDAVSIGAVPVDGEFDTSDPVTPEKPVLHGIEREEELYAAFALIAEKNDSKEFTAQGVPTIKAVEKIVSFDVDRSEVVEAWGEYKIKLAEAE